MKKIILANLNYQKNIRYHKQLISNWIKWYIDNGIKGVSKKVKNKSYTSKI